MKTKLLLFCTGLLTSIALGVRAQSVPFQSTTSFPPAPQWSPATTLWPQYFSPRPLTPLRIPHTDLKLSGPLVDAFRPLPPEPEQSPLQKFLSLPVIRLAVPQRMPSPPGGTGSYFAWRGPSPHPWANVSAGIPPGAALSPIDNRPQGTLITVKP